MIKGIILWLTVFVAGYLAITAVQMHASLPAVLFGAVAAVAAIAAPPHKSRAKSKANS